VQASFSDLEYDAKMRLTRVDRLLAEIEEVTPWTLLVAELEPRSIPKEKAADARREVVRRCCACTSHSNVLGFPMRQL
jgi:hypothetical protein